MTKPHKAENNDKWSKNDVVFVLYLLQRGQMFCERLALQELGDDAGGAVPEDVPQHIDHVGVVGGAPDLRGVRQPGPSARCAGARERGGVGGAGGDRSRGGMRGHDASE